MSSDDRSSVVREVRRPPCVRPEIGGEIQLSIPDALNLLRMRQSPD